MSNGDVLIEKYNMYTCQSCPKNATSNTGSNSSSACLCNPGFSGPNGGPCDPCIEGTYKIETGNVSCKSCPANGKLPAGSTACTCNNGTRRCVDDIVWRSSTQTSCNDYMDFSLCKDGTYGPGWQVQTLCETFQVQVVCLPRNDAQSISTA